MHHGVKGMKWGVRKQEKKLYRERRRELSEQQRKIDKQAALDRNENKKRYKDYLQSTKQAYKSKKIDRHQYKASKKNISNTYRVAQGQLEVNRLVTQYGYEKAHKANKLVYIKNIKTENSRAYRKGQRSLNRSIEYYKGYRIAKIGNNYNITQVG